MRKDQPRMISSATPTELPVLAPILAPDPEAMIEPVVIKTRPTGERFPPAPIPAELNPVAVTVPL
jgi:hypothetical protein